MSAFAEIKAMLVGVAGGRIHPEAATQSVARFVVEMVRAEREACIQAVGKYADGLNDRGQKSAATWVHGARREIEARAELTGGVER